MLCSNVNTTKEISNMLSKYSRIIIKCGRITKYSTTTSRKFERSIAAQKDGKIDSVGKFQSECVSSFDDSNNEKAVETHKPDGWISLNEFQQRRYNLASKLIQTFKQSLTASQQQTPNIHRHVLLIPASEKQFMVGKIPYFYRQATDFRYLTGHLLPDAALLMNIEHSGTQVIYLYSQRQYPGTFYKQGGGGI